MPSKSEQAIAWPVFRPRGWGTPTRARALPKPWFGLDTERNTQPGARPGKFVCGWTVGETIAPFEVLTDLPPATYWVWNLAYDIEGMLRDLDVEEAWAARADGARFELLGGKAVYYHGKRFDWKNPAKGKLSFIEASSFFGRCRLKDIGAKIGIDASTMSWTKYYQDNSEFLCRLSDRRTLTYREAVDWYCQQDARIVYEAVGDLAMGVRALGVELGATPGATARRFLARMGNFPEILWQTHKVFLRSYGGGRFEITKRGVMWDVSQYDYVSAYPAALAQCPWLTETAYSRQTRRFSDDALYGSYEVSFNFDSYLGVAPRWKEGVRVYSSGQESTWLARPEVDWLIKHGAKIDILRGVEVFDPNAGSLWGDVIRELFAMKKRGKKTPEGLGAKIILNSQYGVLIQLVRRSGEWVHIDSAVNPVDFAGLLALEEAPQAFEGGKYYAPLYSGDLTSRVRTWLLDIGEELGDRYIGGHTDSALCFGTIKRNIGDELGQLKLEKHAARAEICKTGMYAMDKSVKVRGITREGTPSVLWQDEHTRNARVGIKSAGNWEDVSVIVPKRVANNFLVEKKRYWPTNLDRKILERGEHVDSEALSYV